MPGIQTFDQQELAVQRFNYGCGFECKQTSARYQVKTHAEYDTKQAFN